jgi:hypothetical protein
MKYVTTILKVAVHNETENPAFGDGNTYVSVEDEGGGSFIIIEQDSDQHGTVILRIDYEELLAVVEASKMLMHQLYVEQAEMK